MQFNWKNLTTVKDDVTIVLQNDWGVIGIENFKNGEPLSVQQQVSLIFIQEGKNYTIIYIYIAIILYVCMYIIYKYI